MNDVLTIMLTELRAAQPMEEHLFMGWLESISQVILAHPTELRRGAATILVANDICEATRVPLIECCKVVVRAVERANGVTR